MSEKKLLFTSTCPSDRALTAYITTDNCIDTYKVWGLGHRSSDHLPLRDDQKAQPHILCPTCNTGSTFCCFPAPAAAAGGDSVVMGWLSRGLLRPASKPPSEASSKPPLTHLQMHKHRLQTTSVAQPAGLSRIARGLVGADSVAIGLLPLAWVRPSQHGTFESLLKVALAPPAGHQVHTQPVTGSTETGDRC